VYGRVGAMKLLSKEISKLGGRVSLIPEDAEDLWTCYNLLAVGDTVRTTTLRKVNEESSTGSVSSEKKKIKLTIRVDNIDFDAQTPVLRLKGVNIVENEFVKLGASHTVELDVNRQFSLAKSGWDSIASELVETSCNAAAKAELAAVVMQEGLAYVCLITPSMTLTMAKIEVSIPRKQGAAAMGRDKAVTRFHDAVMRAIVQYIDFTQIKAVLVASPGFVKDSFLKYMHEQAARQGLRALLDNKSKFVPCHSSSGHKHSLRDVLSDPAVAARLEDTKAAAEVRALNDFFRMLNTDPDRAAYGEEYVLKADSLGAISVLLISDNVLRCSDPAKRAKFVELTESVRDSGGQAHIMSTMHVSGEQLMKLTGLAAILRFPLPELQAEVEADQAAQGGGECDSDEDFDLEELLAP